MCVEGVCCVCDVQVLCVLWLERVECAVSAVCAAHGELEEADREWGPRPGCVRSPLQLGYVGHGVITWLSSSPFPGRHTGTGG